MMPRLFTHLLPAAGFLVAALATRHGLPVWGWL